jgi:hypothetical protein
VGIDEQIWFPVFTLVLGYAGKLVADLVGARQQRSYLLDDRNYQNSVDRWSGQRQAVEDALHALQVSQADWLMVLNLRSNAEAGTPVSLGDRQIHEVFMSARKVVHSGRALSDLRAVNLASDW